MILLLSILLVVFLPIDEPWNIVVLVVGLVGEGAELVVLRRWSKRLDKKTKRTTGTTSMVGKRGEVVEQCRPDGMVRLRGELWKAHCEAGADVGDKVRVEAIDDLTLVVAPD